MLTHIFVKDMAIVTALELDFRPGMTALTGETGAGKSILIDALGLTLGARADNNVIRSGQGRAEISATFDLERHPQARGWLEDNALDDGTQCMLRRVLVRDGRSRAYINGRPAPLAQLQALGNQLLDIHGQHAHQSLLRPHQQRLLLDGFAQHGALVARVADLYREYRDLRSRLEALRAAARDRASRLELLRYQASELEGLGLTVTELQQLDEEQKRLRNLGHLRETCAELLYSLYDADQSVQGRLTRATQALDELQSFDPGLAETGTMVENALIQIQEAAIGLREYGESLELDPARLEQVEGRLEDIHDLARKYRVAPEQLPERLREIQQELLSLEHADVELDALASASDRARAEFMRTAETLSRQRSASGRKLARIVTDSMHGLGMTGGRFEVAVTRLPEDKTAAAGLDQVEFLVTANPGQPLQPLARVASGGELSRISLAIQVATAECGRIPTLIFDEVDVGIGGGVAEIVGQLLRTLGGSRQVLCVTHLPQVAAQSHHHLKVEKYSADDQTYIHIDALPPADRIQEVARMLGGMAITEKTLEHAREMLAASQP